MFGQSVIRPALLVCGLAVVGCGSARPTWTPSSHARAEPVPTKRYALLFVTTFDLASQLMARHLDRVDVPGVERRAVVLEPAQNAAFVSVFRQQLGLHYPVELADFATLNGQGSYGAIRAVPTLILVDANGRELRRSLGVSLAAELEKFLDEGETRADL